MDVSFLIILFTQITSHTFLKYLRDVLGLKVHIAGGVADTWS